MSGTSRRSCCWIALLAAIVSVTSETCNSPQDGQLFVAEEGQIWHLNPQDSSREAYTSAKSVINLAYSHARNTLYYSDLSTRQVYALKDKSTSSPRVVVASQGEWLPWGLSVDDVNDKLYVVESFGSALHAYDLASGESSLVIGTNITRPKDVELDADEGYLFVVDKYQILRAELDGSKPTPIHQQFTTVDQLLDEYPKGLADAIIGSIYPPPDRTKVFREPNSIADLTLDVRAKRVYWVNTLNRTVESSDYNGHNGKVHFRDSSVEGKSESLASLAFLNGSLYWADDVTRKIFKIDATSDESRVVANDIESHAIAAVSCEQRAKTTASPCADNSCQQFCLPSKSSPTGYNCACHVGLELALDGKSCESVEDFVLFTQGRYLRGQSLSDSRKDVIEPSRFAVGEILGVDLDASSGSVYFSSNFPDDQLHRIHLKSGETKVLTPDLLSKNTGHLAYDWTTRNLYYLTYYYADATTLSVLNVDDPTYSKILIKNVPRLVRGLEVHPNKGYVFLARLDVEQRRGTISRLATDGTGLKVILDLEGVESVDALTVDYHEDRIYWTELTSSRKTIVRHANLDGEDVRQLNLPRSLKEVSELAIDDKYIYGIDDNELLFRVDKSGKNLVKLASSREPDLLGGLKLFSRSLQTTRPDHPCKTHTCGKFCFAVPTETNELKGTCGCPYGEKLAEDGLSCVDNSKQEPALLPCKYTSFKCNFQTEA